MLYHLSYNNHVVPQLRIERSSSGLQPDALTCSATEAYEIAGTENSGRSYLRGTQLVPQWGRRMSPIHRYAIQLSKLLSVQRRERVNQDGWIRTP